LDFNATPRPHLLSIKTFKAKTPKQTIKVASLKRLVLYATPLFVAFAGLLIVHFWESDLLAPLFKYERPGDIITTTTEDKMGGGDEYRSVAYFVNVSCFSYRFLQLRGMRGS
jgi:hypothetical protein